MLALFHFNFIAEILGNINVAYFKFYFFCTVTSVAMIPFWNATFTVQGPDFRCFYFCRSRIL